MYYNVIGMVLFLILLFMMGIFIFAVYAGCDPFAQNFITSKVFNLSVDVLILSRIVRYGRMQS